MTVQPTLFEQFLPTQVRTSIPDHNASECQLMSLAIALDARSVRGWSVEEEKLSRNLPPISTEQAEATRQLILAGKDPLGDTFCRIRSPERRRASGATYTPAPIIDAMLTWAAAQATPARIVDPGTGSARYLVHAARHFKGASLVGAELDPLAAMIARANLAVLGLARRAEVLLADFRNLQLPSTDGRTLYVGNPPYIRHHQVDQYWKKWLVREAISRGFSASQLAGSHVYFFLATALHAVPGDYGAFITAAEWLDVNYGSLVRQLFLGPLGGKRVVILEPAVNAFPDAAATAAIAYFEIGSRAPSIRFKRVASVSELADQNGNRLVRRGRLETEKRWSHLTRTSRDIPQGYIELGELCRVHRGQVTGSNKIWISGPHSKGLPESVLVPTVTKARELINAGKVLSDDSSLKRVIDLPVDLGALDLKERRKVERFLSFAAAQGVPDSYVASHRKAWWSVGLREPAPILATYMARRAPAFVRNKVAARHINIAHGLYPREELSDAVLDKLVEFLAATVSQHHGRTYAGGLTKFEPREMERLAIPEPAVLLQMGT